MTSKELRQKFLDFFEKKGHKIVPSSSLLPSDSSVLFTTAGMQQFKPCFLGEKSPYGDKVATCQKCLRTSDINDVGDATHLTFFEMLGNFSFGDYFKQETIEMALEFLNKDCHLPLGKLWFTFFKGTEGLPKDIESREIFLGLGIPKEKIIGFNKDENFWGPTGNEGPCGSTVEIHYDLTGRVCELKNRCLPNCQCGRFIEIWNLVFNEHYQDREKKLTPLKQKGVDTGMGLERLAMLIQGKSNVFETDLLSPAIEMISLQSKTQNLEKHQRIIADHIRSAVFLAGEDINPSNIEQGYILRRVLRRAIRFGKTLGLSENFLIPLAQKIIKTYSGVYPELQLQEIEILRVIKKEEGSFNKALDKGLLEFEKILAKKLKHDIISGEEAFSLFETYGFPLELSQEIAQEKGFSINKKGFRKALEKHQKISRVGAEKKFGGLGKQAENKQAVKLHTVTHLLHSSLRRILGSKVKQMGSDITTQRLRFDFSFDRKLTNEEVKKVEDLINQKIQENLTVVKKEMPLSKALESGALSFFREKYPERVSVYSINNFSKEVCAGPHIKKTGELGEFKIIKQKSIGSGIRRIKAVLV